MLAYIHFYNYERLQAKLNGLSPMESDQDRLNDFYFLTCLLNRVQSSPSSTDLYYTIKK
ncbi:hypothetical protein FLT15_01160 [Paenibacillus thiaminolyticus]|nr:hypothetical protein [Paenibacillus thiaminolyticus]